jgi:hypothetical protein
MASIGDSASVDQNSGISANVDAAVAAATGLRLMGYSCREIAGSAAVASFTIQHSATGAAGTQLVAVELAANGSETKWFGPQGLDCAASGLSINRVAGTLDVTLFYLATPPGG